MAAEMAVRTAWGGDMQHQLVLARSHHFDIVAVMRTITGDHVSSPPDEPPEADHSRVRAR